MRFWCRVLCASLLGLSLTILIIYWELRSADLQWQWNGGPLLESSRKKESLDSYLDRGQSLGIIRRGEGQNREEKTGYFRRLIKDTYIYSAFYELQDNNEDTIRLIILSGKYYQPKIVCHFCDPSETGCVCPPQTAELYTNNENHGRSYGGYIATCGVPQCFKDSADVFITAEGKEETSEKVRVPLLKAIHKSTPVSYAICMPPLIGQGFDFLHRLIEFVELTRILGAKHFTFYDYDLDDQVQNVLRYYRDQGVVTVLPWNLPEDVTMSGQNLWYHGQVLATQDCLYRHKGIARFVAFNDIDEFIVPLTHPTIPQLLNDIHTKNFCGHCFDSVIFSLNARMPKAHKQSQLVSQRVFYRTNDKLSSWSKCIVDPRQVFEMGIHHVSKSRREQLTMNKVDEKLGLVFHYRTCSSAYGIGKACGNLVADYTLERLGKKLQKKVDEVLKHVDIKPERAIKEAATVSRDREVSY